MSQHDEAIQILRNSGRAGDVRLAPLHLGSLRVRKRVGIIQNHHILGPDAAQTDRAG